MSDEPSTPASDDGAEGGTTFGSIEPIEIQQEMEQSFLDYAMSVIVSRALPDARERAQARAPTDPLGHARGRAPP